MNSRSPCARACAKAWAAVAGTCFHTAIGTPRTVTWAVSNAWPGAVRRACASTSESAGQFLDLSYMAGLSITTPMTMHPEFSEAGFSQERLARIPRFLESQVG